ncbi:MAG: phosphoribosylformylglycinamidine synthase subunit PurS [Alphaproteobacteria bacterium]|nr:phosphoribosylformylglycinamidine synthase subunit PurS [Alphaproteobacteria bacterium]
MPATSPGLKARIHVTLKPGVLDPQGKAVQHALEGLGFGGVRQVRQGKVLDLVLAETDPAVAKTDLERMCETLLANMVIEDFHIELAE